MLTQKEKNVEALKVLVGNELGFSHPEYWDVLIEHIEVHKYFVNQKLPYPITWDDAVFSWYENTLVPIKRAIEQWNVRSAFGDTPEIVLFLAVSTHWYYLQERDPNASADDAAVDFAARYGQGLARWFSRFLQPGVE